MKFSPMNKDFIVFCCLHSGPLSPSTIDQKCNLSGEQLSRNKKFLGRLIDTYGSCAMLGMKGDSVVAHARFYPQYIYDQLKSGWYCCHDPNPAISQEIEEIRFPPMAELTEKILRIACFFVPEVYRGQGLSHKFIETIVDWAKRNSWESVHSIAYQDNYWLSSEMCTPMVRTYTKHGFRTIGTVMIPEAMDLLKQMKHGDLGAERKKGFEKYCGNKDLSELATFYKMEYKLN